MKKRTYKLECTDFIGRKWKKDIPANDIVSAINQAKNYVKINHIVIGWVISPNGKKYIV